MAVALVTDSTAYLPDELVTRHGITVVAVQVVIGGTAHDEGTGVSSDTVAEALRDWRPVTTSRPSPQAFLDAYEAVAASGASASTRSSIRSRATDLAITKQMMSVKAWLYFCMTA